MCWIVAFLVLMLSLNAESFKDCSVVWVICRVLLFVGEHCGCSTLSNNQHSPSLTPVSFQVATQTFRFCFFVCIFPFGGTELRQKSHQAEPLESKLLEASLGLINIQLTSKEFSLDKLLHPQSLQTNPNQPDIVLLELGQNRRNLFCRQPTEGSSKPPEEDNDTGLVGPQLGKRDLGPIRGRDQTHLSNTGWVHDDVCWFTSLKKCYQAM